MYGIRLLPATYSGVLPAAPQAMGDSYSLDVDETVTLHPLDNDTGTGLEVTSIGPATAGVLSQSGAVITYKAPATAQTVTIPYTVTDDYGRTASSSIGIEVSAVDDPDTSMWDPPWDTATVTQVTSFNDLKNEYLAASAGDIIVWTGSGTSEHNGDDWSLTKSGTGAGRIWICCEEPLARKLNRLKINLNASHIGFWGWKLGGKVANCQPAFMQIAGSTTNVMISRVQLLGWGPNAPANAGAVQVSTHGLYVGGLATDMKVGLTEIGDPVAWTAVENQATIDGLKYANAHPPQQWWGFLRMGFRIAGETMANAALRCTAYGCYIHHMLPRPGTQDYHHGQTDFLEWGMNGDNWAANTNCGHTMTKMLFTDHDANPGSGIVDLKAPGTVCTDVTILRDKANNGSLDMRGDCGGFTLKGVYTEDCNGIAFGGPNNTAMGCHVMTGGKFRVICGSYNKQGDQTHKPSSGGKIIGCTGEIELGTLAGTVSYPPTPTSDDVLNFHIEHHTGNIYTQQPYTWSDGQRGTYHEHGNASNYSTSTDEEDYVQGGDKFARKLTTSQVGPLS